MHLREATAHDKSCWNRVMQLGRPLRTTDPTCNFIGEYHQESNLTIVCKGKNGHVLSSGIVFPPNDNTSPRSWSSLAQTREEVQVGSVGESRAITTYNREPPNFVLALSRLWETTIWMEPELETLLRTRDSAIGEFCLLLYQL